jgi:hypothetical protein
MTSLEIKATATHVNVNTPDPNPQHAMQYQSGYTDSLDLMRMQVFLLRLVGPQGVQALILRNRQLCGHRASSAELSSGLLRLSADMLGEPLAQRMLQSEWGLNHVFSTN